MPGIVDDRMNKVTIMDTEDRIEKFVDIYDSAEALRDMKHKKDTEDFNTTTPQTAQRTGSDGVKIRSSRAAVVCLVLLCVLLLTTVIGMGVYIHKTSTNYAEERQQLLTNITNLIQLNELSKFIQDGWVYYQFSLYYVSNEMKNWTESRRYCTERGADLLIINNTEEQGLVNKISNGSDVWIGLSDSEEEGRWKWVDGSTLTFMFWKPGEPNGHEAENCAMSRSTGWFDYPCSSTFKWICERKNIK